MAISGGLEVSVYAVVGDRIGKFKVNLTIWSGPISRSMWLLSTLALDNPTRGSGKWK